MPGVAMAPVVSVPGWIPVGGGSGVVVGEAAGQVVVGAGLGQEGLSLLLDRVGAGREAQRRLVLARTPERKAERVAGTDGYVLRP